MSKIKINLNKPFTNLEGTAIPETQDGKTLTNQGKSLAQYMAQTNKGNAIKLLALAIDLHKTGEIEVDEADFKTIRDMVESNEQYSNLVKAQIMKELDEAKETSKKEPKKDVKLEKVK
jgi:cytochrome c-type biogenesis protein CcmH/NrfG